LIRRLVVLAAVLVLGTTASGQSVSIQLQGTTFKVVGWQATSAPSGGWASVFKVYAGAGDLPPMVGTYAVENGSLIFTPRYPLADGVIYRAVFQPPVGPTFRSGANVVEQTFTLAKKNTAPVARVDRVYPSADILPSNLLRLYVYFSAPMSRGEAARRIHVLDANGKELSALFLPGEELWDPAIQRLTMTFDPGRIKRGLASNEKMGPPIAEGQRYTLVIDQEWPDARGVPLVEGFRKAFRGGPAVRTPPDQKTWRLMPPRAGSSDPLVVDFGRSMNYPLLQRMLQVAGPRGNVDGTMAVDRNESLWRFTPRTAWQAGVYRLVADTRLEDVAGNSIGHPFDIDVFDRVTEHITTDTVAVPFTVAIVK
jgi:hypothetical protein